VTYLLGRELYSEKAGLLAAALIAALPLSFRVARQAYPDALFSLFALASLYFLLLLKKEGEMDIYKVDRGFVLVVLTGVSIGLGMSTKILGPVFIVFIPLFLLVTRKDMERKFVLQGIFFIVVTASLTYVAFTAPFSLVDALLNPTDPDFTGGGLLSLVPANISGLFGPVVFLLTPLFYLTLLVPFLILYRRKPSREEFFLMFWIGASALLGILFSGFGRRIFFIFPLLSILTMGYLLSYWKKFRFVPLLAVIIIASVLPFSYLYGLRNDVIPADLFFNVKNTYTIHEDAYSAIIDDAQDQASIGFIAKTYEIYPRLYPGHHVTSYQQTDTGFSFEYLMPGERLKVNDMLCCNIFTGVFDCCSQCDYIIIEEEFREGFNAPDFSEWKTFSYSDSRGLNESYFGSDILHVFKRQFSSA
jgi:hypothetical protein